MAGARKGGGGGGNSREAREDGATDSWFELSGGLRKPRFKKSGFHCRYIRQVKEGLLTHQNERHISCFHQNSEVEIPWLSILRRK